MEIELQKLVDNKILKWLPWIGKNYENSEIKILIVGESHYFNPEEIQSFEKHQNILFTREVIEEMPMNRDYYQTKVFQNFHRAILGNDTFDAEKFWNQISFYNFIQKPMNSNKGRPTNVDYFENWNGFVKLVETIKPTICIFIGSSAANSFNTFFSQSSLDFIPVENIEKIGVNYAKKSILKVNNLELPIHFIKHTSQYFSWNKWHDYLKNTIPNEIEFLEKIV